MTLDCDLWQGIVSIAQVPNDDGTKDDAVSWLCNPFGDGTVYTSQFVLNLGKNDDNFS